MLNKICFWLLCIGIVYGFCKGAYQSFDHWRLGAIAPAVNQNSATVDAAPKVATPATDGKKAQEKEPGLTAAGKRLNEALLDAAKTTIDICIKLIGTMALWLGLLNVAKEAGLIDAFARAMRPLMRRLFPEVPDGHPAHAAMLLNIAANMLGLDNAATPMGLKAMEELQTLNPVKDTATNSMALFLAINCGSVTLIPFTIISLRFISGSKDPAGIIGGCLIASCASVVAGITAARLLSKSSRFQIAGQDLQDAGERDR
jgi:spore maturation protein SpmA